MVWVSKAPTAYKLKKALQFSQERSEKLKKKSKNFKKENRMGYQGLKPESYWIIQQLQFQTYEKRLNERVFCQN